MLIPIIKDFNNAFSYLVSNSVEKTTKEVFDPVSKSLVRLSENQSDQSGAINDIFKIGWTVMKTCFFFLLETIQYIVSFQWLRDFAYLPVSIPNNLLRFSNETNIPLRGPHPVAIQNLNNTISSLVSDSQNLLQRFLFSNQTILQPHAGLGLDSPSLPYNNFILGLPNVTDNGVPVNSWGLSFLSNKWFDPLTVPVNFLSTTLESNESKISQLSDVSLSSYSDRGVSNLILMCILICLATGFSSFLNSFFISFPLSLSNLLSVRYLIIQKFWAGCISILGIVFGEIVFMLSLILPAPFIQITLVYLESVWPYVIGLSLIIFIIFDLISNPYANTISLGNRGNRKPGASGSPAGRTKFTGMFGNTKNTGFLSKIPVGGDLLRGGFKIFGFSFLLALTEQSCYFSFFGSLNLSSTGNFLDTYLFTASKSPMVLIFSCMGFLIGSFLAITIYNLIIAKMIFLVAWLGIKIKQFNPNSLLTPGSRPNRISKAPSNFATRLSDSQNSRLGENNWVLVSEIYTTIKNHITVWLRFFFSRFSKDSLKSVGLFFRSCGDILQLLITNLPGGKRIIFFIFPGQANSYKYNSQNTRETQYSRRDETKNQNESIETRIENMLRGSASASTGGNSSVLPPQLNDRYESRTADQESLLNRRGAGPSPGNVSSLGGSAFYNKIDKILLTGLITLSFTTIPYYSFDYLINSFLGFTPQDQVLNAHSLRVNFPDYTNLLGITLSDNNSVINTDVSLYDRAHFMYGEWPNSFESLNYQGELMWTNLRDHRRQKRTRRSTRLKFKTLKTKIATSWKEFKLSSGFTVSTRRSSFDESKTDTNRKYENPRREGYTTFSPFSPWGSVSETNKQVPAGADTVKHNKRLVQESLRNRNNSSNLFYKIFFATAWGSPSGSPFLPFANSTQETGKYGSKTQAPISQTKEIPTHEIMSVFPYETRASTSLSETIKPLSTSTFIDLSGGEKYIKTYPKNWKRVITEKYYQNPIYRTVLSNDLKNFLKREPFTQQLTNNQENELYFLRVKMAHYYDSLRFYFTLKEQINSTRPKADTFFKSRSQSPQSSGFEKTVNESKPVTDIADRSSNSSLNPRYRDSRNESTRDVSKKDSSSLEFEKIWNDKQKNSQSAVNKINSRSATPKSIISLQGLDNQTKDGSVFSKASAGIEKESLKRPPFVFKSMTSMNYRQQFKGTLKTVKQLFAISPVFSNPQYEQSVLTQDNSSESIPINTFVDTDENKPIHRKENTSQNNPRRDGLNVATRVPNQPGNSPDAGYIPNNPGVVVEKSYKYDKYLFNEYSYPKNEFLHEENDGLPGRKSLPAGISTLRESANSGSSLTNPKLSTTGNPTATVNSRGSKGISVATKTLYNMFGSNDPFYVGWDENLRKFVLTSRILSRSSALNYNTLQDSRSEGSRSGPKSNAAYRPLNQNKKPKQLTADMLNSAPSGLPADKKPGNLNSASNSSTNQTKTSNTPEKESSSSVPTYSNFGCPSTSCQNIKYDSPPGRNNIKRLAHNRPVNKNPNGADSDQSSVHIYRPYTSWPFFKHQLKNLPNRPYFVLYENYLNILNKRIHLFSNININDIDTKSLTFLYSYSFNNNVKKYVSQLPINIYKQSMRPSSLENLFTPTSNARSSFLWPGSIMPAWEYYFW